MIETSLLNQIYAIDAYCDNDELELKFVHPQLMNFTNLEVSKENFMVYKEWSSDSPFGNSIASPLVQFFSNHFAYRKVCQKNFPDLDETRCAVQLGLMKPHEEYDTLPDQSFIYGDFTDPEASIAPL